MTEKKKAINCREICKALRASRERVRELELLLGRARDVICSLPVNSLCNATAIDVLNILRDFDNLLSHEDSDD